MQLNESPGLFMHNRPVLHFMYSNCPAAILSERSAPGMHHIILTGLQKAINMQAIVFTRVMSGSIQYKFMHAQGNWCCVLFKVQYMLQAQYTVYVGCMLTYIQNYA